MISKEKGEEKGAGLSKITYCNGNRVHYYRRWVGKMFSLCNERLGEME